MKSLKQLFEEMGFNPTGPLATQKAFFKYLATAAQSSTTNTPAHKSGESTVKAKIMEQLEFDLTDKKRVS